MKIPRAVFGIINVASETPHGKYGIAGVRLVRLNPSTCAAIATDGRIVMEITWHDEASGGLDFAATIAGEHWDAAIAGDPKELSLNESRPNGKIELEAETSLRTHTVSGMPCARLFPNHESVIPQYTADEAIEIGVSPVSLGALCLAFAGLDSDFTRMKLIVPKDAKRPLRLENMTDGEVRARAAIMPIAAKDE